MFGLIARCDHQYTLWGACDCLFIASTFIQAPNTLVLHARAGNCFGDMASYDYFSLGGPYSVRGYSHGELGACRRFLETAAEVRVPLKNHGLPGDINQRKQSLKCRLGTTIKHGTVS